MCGRRGKRRSHPDRAAETTPTEYRHLVEFLGRRFAAVDHRLAAVESRFGGLEGRLDAMRDNLDEKFPQVLGQFDESYRRVDRLEQEYVGASTR
jgi:hypothetical protein